MNSDLSENDSGKKSVDRGGADVFLLPTALTSSAITFCQVLYVGIKRTIQIFTRLSSIFHFSFLPRDMEIAVPPIIDILWLYFFLVPFQERMEAPASVSVFLGFPFLFQKPQFSSRYGCWEDFFKNFIFLVQCFVGKCLITPLTFRTEVQKERSLTLKSLLLS